MQFQTNVDVNQLNLVPGRPTVLVVADSAAIHSGFAQVVRNVFKPLQGLKEWSIVQFGWWHQAPMERIPWPIITTDRDPNNPAFINQADKYGELSYARVVEAVNPDLVWVMGDPWMVAPVLNEQFKGRWPTIYYAPVDGAPLRYSWDVVNLADVVVPYLPWGKKMIERWWPKANIVSHIPHGVDTRLYKPFDKEERSKIRTEDFGASEDDIIMMSVSRNQSRKNLPALIEATRYIRTGDYRVCSECGRAYRNPFDYHLGRPTGEKAVCKDPTCWSEYPGGAGHREPDMKPGVPHENFYYYMHTPITDLEGASYRLLDVLYGFGCGVQQEDGSTRYPGFRWNEHLKAVHGMSEHELIRLYGAVDIFALAATGEGFGLPIIEAMSCGTPVVVSNVSSHPDFAADGGQLVNIAYHVCEPVSGYYRGYVDIDDLLTKILLYVDNELLRKKHGIQARKAALQYDWDDIAFQWRKVINDTLASRPKSESWMRVSAL